LIQRAEPSFQADDSKPGVPKSGFDVVGSKALTRCRHRQALRVVAISNRSGNPPLDQASLAEYIELKPIQPISIGRAGARTYPHQAARRVRRRRVDATCFLLHALDEWLGEAARPAFRLANQAKDKLLGLWPRTPLPITTLASIHEPVLAREPRSKRHRRGTPPREPQAAGKIHPNDARFGFVAGAKAVFGRTPTSGYLYSFFYRTLTAKTPASGVSGPQSQRPLAAAISRWGCCRSLLNSAAKDHRW